MAVDPCSLDPIGRDDRPGFDHSTYAGATPPADTRRKTDAGLTVSAEPEYHPIPGRPGWQNYASTQGDKFMMPFGRRDADWDDAVTPDV